jgi:hypothetical protein
MLVLLRMLYPHGSIKFHIIGIVPVTIDYEIYMHIVEGCRSEKKESLSTNQLCFGVVVNANHILFINL